MSETVEWVNPGASSSIVLVCEHASAVIPREFRGLGLSGAALHSHIAWDPGAMAVARAMARRLDAVLMASDVSRLVYDCNRPPQAEDAMPARSEVFDIPGNKDLSDEERRDRTARYYEPFRAGLASILTETSEPILVTIHSFTPVYHGQNRAVEIGILHDKDTRLADAMLASAPEYCDLNVQRNAPYGPGDGVTHTLKTHAVPHGHLNVMIEIRNDLIAAPDAQEQVGDMLALWVEDAAARAAMKDVGQWTA